MYCGFVQVENFEGLIFHGRNVWGYVQEGYCPGWCLDPRAKLQVFMFSGYDWQHPG